MPMSRGRKHRPLRLGWRTNGVRVIRYCLWYQVRSTVTYLRCQRTSRGSMTVPVSYPHGLLHT